MCGDDPILLAALERAGHEAVHWRWDDTGVDWGSVDVAIIRSTWDYFERPEEFRVWLVAARHQTRLVNPPDLLEWNLDKHYLRELAGAGLPVVPTEYIELEAGLGDAITRASQESGSAIVKPVVSGGAWGLHHVVPGQDWSVNVARAPWMVQPFVPEIETEGELAVIILGGRVNHGIRKRAASGDFRVQSEHGGSNTIELPSDEACELALASLRACPGTSCYARVDMVRHAGRLEIMEVELVEPELFFVLVPSAADRLVACL